MRRVGFRRESFVKLDSLPLPLLVSLPHLRLRVKVVTMTQAILPLESGVVLEIYPDKLRFRFTSKVRGTHLSIITVLSPLAASNGVNEFLSVKTISTRCVYPEDWENTLRYFKGQVGISISEYDKELFCRELGNSYRSVL